MRRGICGAGASQRAKGRLELVGTSRGAPIFIDYAHKPDALAKALEALRPAVTGRLVVVFGAGAIATAQTALMAPSPPKKPTG